MLRSAAKNYRSVTVVTDPADYDRVLDGDERSTTATPRLRLREELAIKVFQRTAEYDAAIANFLGQCEDEHRGALLG